jgi:hypothetical protein
VAAPGIWRVGFLTGHVDPSLKRLLGQDVSCVFVPHTPNPASGFVHYVPKQDLVELDWPVEDGLRVIVSGGIVQPGMESWRSSPRGAERARAFRGRAAAAPLGYTDRPAPGPGPSRMPPRGCPRTGAPPTPAPLAMAIVTTEGIVLKTHALGDTSRIVTVYTRDHGLRKLVAKGARKTPSRFGYALEPLSRSRFVIYLKPDRDLHLLSRAEVVDALGSRLADLSGSRTPRRRSSWSTGWCGAKKPTSGSTHC